MNKKYPILSLGIGMPIFFTVILVSGFSDNGVGMILEQDKVTQYIPSNITKANPNILIASPHGSHNTTNINDIADEIFITVKGTVLEIGEYIEWFEPGPTGWGHGVVPITISVEQVYKGEIDSDTFTFFISGYTVIVPEGTHVMRSTDPSVDRKFLLYPWEPQFEIGENVLMHLTHLLFDKNRFANENIITNNEYAQLLISDYNTVGLGENGKYQLHDNRAYNAKFPDGILLQTAISQSKNP